LCWYALLHIWGVLRSKELGECLETFVAGVGRILLLAPIEYQTIMCSWLVMRREMQIVSQVHQQIRDSTDPVQQAL